MSEELSAPTEADAVEALHALGCTDGLPVIVPTAERVQRMVLAGGQDGDLILGTMGPGNGVASIEKVAVAAVMAGCLPDYFPVVLAAAKAVIDERFDLTEMQGTTHCTAPLIIVNGPARHSCGPIAARYGALGPGHRANATIGRALRLAMINIGGAKPGESDMALLGHPGKFTYCLAEDEENSPFEPLHVALGFGAEDSTVTVIGAEAPQSVIYSGNADDPKNHRHLLKVLALGLAGLASNNAILRAGQAVVVLNPDHAAILHDAGLQRSDIQEQLFELCSHTVAEISEVAGSFSPAGKDADKRFYAFSDKNDIVVIMAGGSGLYSMVMPTWCAGKHKNRAITVPIDVDQFCEIPGS